MKSRGLSQNWHFHTTFPVLCVVIFYEKIFSWFFIWVNFGDSQTIFGIQAGRTNIPMRYGLLVATEDPKQYMNTLDLSLLIDHRKFFIKSHIILLSRRQNFNIVR